MLSLRIQFLVGFVAGSLLLGLGSLRADGPVSKGPNVQVDSRDIAAFSTVNKKDKEERLSFYRDDSTSVGFNDDGEPNVNMRW